jgi:alkanesulfonate monooxygenase SsuD/methylene tetrahydromethanopterin reductase-like flavin-dependent oxidoreductase (luciferase family)
MPEPTTPHDPLLFAALPAVRPARDDVPWQRPLTDAALAAEHAGIDALVVECGAGIEEPALDPVVVLAGLAPRTYRLGLVAEVPNSSAEPGRLAGELATLDTISGGRAGWLLPETGGQDGPTEAGLSLDVFTVALEPDDAVAERLAAALADTRTDGLLLRFPGGPAGLLRFAHGVVPLLRERAVLPERRSSPQQLRARLGPGRPVTVARGPAA